MCNSKEMLEYISSHKLEHVARDIAPWLCTAWPVDLYGRRYWSFTCENGDVWVSRTLAQSKQFFLQGKPLDSFDQCVICQKYLVSEYHVFMPVFLWEENPPKTLIWKWQNSRTKACFLHFMSSKCKMVLGRNPNKLTKKNSKFQDQQLSNSQAPIKQLDFSVPDEY